MADLDALTHRPFHWLRTTDRRRRTRDCTPSLTGGSASSSRLYRPRVGKALTEQLSLFGARIVRKLHPRDELWDAWAEVWGEPQTKTERARVNAALKELRAISATADDVRRALTNYGREFPGIVPSPQGVTGNWTLLTARAKPAEARTSTCQHGVSFFERCPECEA